MLTTLVIFFFFFHYSFTSESATLTLSRHTPSLCPPSPALQIRNGLEQGYVGVTGWHRT
ncbi:hypothetical protein AZE42_13791 [Rhizopogon vesiculosus]|uniref:Secreted protein n=1 Tax=Rhizopogon vesiculosus TaxID=180088 RepID=A0A1J8QK92_9AGAM|nr:hypothetical protein AZE42_13791 [Rhizopogon vesiculosus]